MSLNISSEVRFWNCTEWSAGSITFTVTGCESSSTCGSYDGVLERGVETAMTSSRESAAGGTQGLNFFLWLYYITTHSQGDDRLQGAAT